MRGLACAAALVLWIAPLAARAGEGPQDPHRVGDRAMGFAGSFAGVADDPSTAFHNPGGVGLLGTSSLSGSLTVFGLGGRDVANGYRTSFGTADLGHDGSLGRPVFLGGVVRFGSKDAEGVRRHALGASFLSPYTNEYQHRSGVRRGESTARILVQRDERARWYGLSYGYRLAPDIALGFSLFLVDASLDHDELERLSDDGPVADLLPDAFLTRETQLSIRSFALAPRLGLLWDVRPRVRVGLVFAPPAFELDASARTHLVESRIDAGGIATSRDVLRQDLDASLQMPWELRAGASYRTTGSSLLSVDLSVLGPQRSAATPLLRVDLPAGDETLGLYAPRAAHREVALRAAAGFEFVVGGVVPIRGGVLFRLPGAPAIPAVASEPADDRLVAFGGALSAGYQAGAYDFAFGVSAVFANGHASSPLRDPAGAPVAYRRVDATEHSILFFVAGGTRTAALVARELVERVGNAGDPDEEADDPPDPDAAAAPLPPER